VTPLLAVAVPVAAAGWLGHSWWFPYKTCTACKGRMGRGTGSSRRSYNRCWRCKGNPEQVRLGARLISNVTGRPVRGSKGQS
jgi:hypothetical protein